MTRTASVALAWLAGGAFALVLTLAYIDRYGTLNQATYLLDPLRRAMPELYRHDWFVSGTPPYLPTFGWVTAWLFRIDPDGPMAVLAAHVVVTMATYAAICAVIRAVSSDPRVCAIVPAVSALTLGRTLGGNYLLAGYLQPASIATLGWVIAMAALVRGRFLVCGIALALAGWMHVNYLVLGIGLFTLVALWRRGVRLGELVRLLAPQLVVLAWFLPDLLSAAGPSAQAVRILVEFHAPGHYAAGRLAAHLPELALWQLAAWAALPLLDARGELRMLWRFSQIVLAICAATTLIVWIPALSSLTQVRWSRIAPFGQLACQVIVVAALLGAAAAQATGAPGLSAVRRLAIAAATVLAVLATCRFLHVSPAPTIVLAASVLAVSGAALWQVRFARSVATAFTAGIVAATLWASPRGEGLTTQTAGSPGERALASWAQRETAPDAVFLTPPSMSRFRLLARRAIVVDTKSPPLRPDALVQWYRRLCAVVQVSDAPTHEWVEARWDQLTPGQRETVARSFGADYIVVGAGVAMPGTPVYANDEYAVYRTSG